MWRILGVQMTKIATSKERVDTFLQIELYIFNRPLVKSVYQKSISYFSTKTYVVGTQKNSLNEKVILSTQNMGKKIFTILRWHFLFI